MNPFAGMLDHIIVETSGVKMPLIRLAVVSVIDPKTLSINPYDPNVIFFLSQIMLVLVSIYLALLQEHNFRFPLDLF